MKVKRVERGYTLFASDAEMEILRLMVAQAQGNLEAVEQQMSVGMRRSYGRRCGKRRQLDFLRTDIDARKDKI